MAIYIGKITSSNGRRKHQQHTESAVEKSKQIVAIARVCVLLYVIMLPNHGYLIRLSRFSAAALAVELSCVYSTIILQSLFSHITVRIYDYTHPLAYMYILYLFLSSPQYIVRPAGRHLARFSAYILHFVQEQGTSIYYIDISGDFFTTDSMCC